MTTAAFQLIVGLGNPGARYEGTRHNAGFWFLAALARQLGISLRDSSKFQGWHGQWVSEQGVVHLVCPSTFMNHSGRCVSAIAQFYRLSRPQILVIHDEIDLEPGVVRLKEDGGHGGHNGLRDIVSALGGTDFCRLRIGVGHPGSRDLVVPYVLGEPGRDEKAAILAGIEAGLACVPDLMAGHWAEAQQTLHRRH